MEHRRVNETLKVCETVVKNVSDEVTAKVLRDRTLRNQNVCRIPIRNATNSKLNDIQSSTRKILKTDSVKGYIAKPLSRRSVNLNGTFTQVPNTRSNQKLHDVVTFNRNSNILPSSILNNTKTLSRIPIVLIKKMLDDSEKENQQSPQKVLRSRVVKKAVTPTGAFISTVQTGSSSTTNKTGDSNYEAKYPNAVATVNSFVNSREKGKTALPKGNSSLGINKRHSAERRVLRNRISPLISDRKNVENKCKSTDNSKTSLKIPGSAIGSGTRSKTVLQESSQDSYLIGKGSLRKRPTVPTVLGGLIEPPKNFKVPKLGTKKTELKGNKLLKGCDSEEQIDKAEHILCSTPLKNSPLIDRKLVAPPKQMQIPLSPIKPSNLNILDDATAKKSPKRPAKKVDAPKSLSKVKKMTSKGPSIPLKRNTTKATRSSTKVAINTVNKKETDLADENKHIPTDFLDKAEAVLLARPIRSYNTTLTTKKMMHIHSSDSSSGNDSLSSNYNPFELFVLDEPIKFLEEVPNPCKRSRKPNKPKLDDTYVLEEEEKKQSRKKLAGVTEKEAHPNDGVDEEEYKSWLKEAEEFNNELSRIENVELCVE